MQKRTRWFVVATLTTLVVGAWPAGAAPEATYAIRLSRPQKVGDRFAVAVKGRQHKKERVTMASRVVTDTDTTIDVDVEALAEVLAVDAKAQGTRMAYTIERCQKTANAQTTELLARGRVVVVEHREGKARYTVDGERPPKDLEDALGIVISAHEPNSATDDEIFGTKERKRVGDEWAINAEAAARDFTSRGVKIEPSSITGATKLVAAKRHEGQKVLELSGKIRIGNLALPLPAGAVVDKSYVEALFWGLFPEDPKSTRRVAESMLLKTGFAVRMQKPDTGEEVLVEALIEQGHQAKFAPVRQ
ncbi:MAG: hypothetical protein HY906_27475 [Deltaproteobacteria bacterium]|nr:hypothetical protein [Deltaproteobacteria bacterium]